MICFLNNFHFLSQLNNNEYNLIFTVAIVICLERCKNAKYYYCATFFVYEFIGVLSIITLVHSLWTNLITVSMQERLIVYHIQPFETTIMSIADFVNCISAFLCCVHWIQSTMVHISLCKSRLLPVSQIGAKNFFYLHK